MKVFLLDNYDSFTYMLKDNIEQCGVECIVKRNDDPSINENSLNSYDAIILSPGPKTPKESGCLMNIISFYHQRKPILGVCLGHQGIGEFFGARLCKSSFPMHGKVDHILHNGHQLFQNIDKGNDVTRYHSLLLEDIKQELEVIAWNANNEVMAIAHKILPVYGIQFHPESYLTKNGLTLIKNFLNLSKQLA